MGEQMWGIATIGGPIILLVAFIWVVMRSNKRRAGEASPEVTERATKAQYEAQERRHDEGTEGES